MSQLDQILADLKQARADAEFYVAEKNAILDAAKASSNYQLADQSHAKAKSQIEHLESLVRDAAIAEFNASGAKKIHPSVTVKIFKVFRVLDKNLLREWCVKNLPVVLQPDLKKVESYVKDVGNVDGAELVDEPRAQIASEL